MVFDWLSQQGQNLRRILAPKTIRPAVQPTTPATQATTPARREPNTVFYGRGYTRPATQRPPAPRPAVRRVQDLRQALAPKRPKNPISPAPVQARRPPAQQRTPTPATRDERTPGTPRAAGTSHQRPQEEGETLTPLMM